MRLIDERLYQGSVRGDTNEVEDMLFEGAALVHLRRMYMPAVWLAAFDAHLRQTGSPEKAVIELWKVQTEELALYIHNSQLATGRIPDDSTDRCIDYNPGLRSTPRGTAAYTSAWTLIKQKWNLKICPYSYSYHLAWLAFFGTSSKAQAVQSLMRIGIPLSRVIFLAYDCPMLDACLEFVKERGDRVQLIIRLLTLTDNPHRLDEIFNLVADEVLLIDAVCSHRELPDRRWAQALRRYKAVLYKAAVQRAPAWKIQGLRTLLNPRLEVPVYFEAALERELGPEPMNLPLHLFWRGRGPASAPHPRIWELFAKNPSHIWFTDHYIRKYLAMRQIRVIAFSNLEHNPMDLSEEWYGRLFGNLQSQI